jgi:hypothetical protein
MFAPTDNGLTICFQVETQSVEEIAKRKGVGARYVRRLMRLAFLAPKIVEIIAVGKKPQDLTAEALAERIHLPLLWTEQEKAVGVSLVT